MKINIVRMRSRQSGFSLIEVLVASVILAVGILGIAGLQVVSLQQNRSSLLRSEALQIGNDILDRMRANPEEDYAGVDFGDAPPADAINCELVTANCSKLDMRKFDQATWLCSIDPLKPGTTDLYDICEDLGFLAGSLPGGEGQIVFANNIHEVAVRWIDDGDGNMSTVTLRSRTDKEPE